MKVDIKGTKIKLTPEIKNYVQKKMDMLEKYLGKVPVIACDVEVGLAVGGQKCGEIFRTEVIMEIPGALLVIEKHESDLYKSIDKVKDHLARSIKNYKEKLIDKRRKGR